MKNQNSRKQKLTYNTLTILIISTIFVLFGATTVKAESVKIHLQLETFDATLFNDDLEVAPCLASVSSTEPTLTTWCAIQQLAETKGWTITHSGEEKKFLSSINNYNGADYNWWAFFHNLGFADEALNEYILLPNDRIILSYGIFPMKVETDTNNPLVNTTTTLKAYSFGFDPVTWSPVWSLSTDTTLVINDEEKISSDGTFELKINDENPYNIYSKKSGSINSDVLVITPQIPTSNNLRLQVSTTTPYTNTTTTITLEESSLDNNWNTVWTTSTSSTITVDNLEYPNDSGIYQYFATDTLSHTIYGKKTDFIDSTSIIITAMVEETTPEPDPIQPSQGGGSSGSSHNATPVSDEQINQTVEKISNYIKSKQDNSGMITDPSFTDWSIMAFGAKDIYSSTINNGGTSLIDYSYNYNFTNTAVEQNLCAGYTRHILAFLAAGVNPNDNKIKSIPVKMDSECNETNEYGLPGINDDVFALITLLALDKKENPIVEKSKNYITTYLNSNPSSPSFVGIAISALEYAQKKGLIIDQEVINKGKNILKNNQLTDGGWKMSDSDTKSDPTATSWVMMGINALGENQSQWLSQTTGKNPWNFMIDNLNFNGYFNDDFANKHAIPALLGKSWPIILSPQSVNQISIGAGGSTDTSTTTPASTVPIVSPTSSLIYKIKLNPDDFLTPSATEPIVELTKEEIIIEPVLLSNSENQNIPDTISKPKLTQQNTKVLEKNQLEETITNNSPLTKISDGTEFKPTTSSTPKLAKGIFGGSVALAGSLGLYLGWRLLQSLI